MQGWHPVFVYTGSTTPSYCFCVPPIITPQQVRLHASAIVGYPAHEAFFFGNDGDVPNWMVDAVQPVVHAKRRT